MMKVQKAYRLLLSILFFSLFSFEYSSGQDILTQVQSGKDVNVVFKKEALGGAFIHSQGWGMFYRNASILSIHSKRFWELETGSIHNPKEQKIQNSLYPDAKGYYYGKLNALQIFRFGVGYYQTLWRKNDERCVEVDAVYSLGPSIAVAKPVYLQIIQSTPNPNEFLLSTEKYDPKQDTPANIYGRASFFNGIGELSLYPGGYARAGINFDYANRHNLVKAIETGVEVDVYPKIIPIMAFTPNSQFFVNLYLSFSVGKRWF